MQPDQNSFLEGEALRLAQQGAATAFEFLYRPHRDRVYALCVRMVKKSDSSRGFDARNFSHHISWNPRVPRSVRFHDLAASGYPQHRPHVSSQEKARGNVNGNRSDVASAGKAFGVPPALNDKLPSKGEPKSKPDDPPRKRERAIASWCEPLEDKAASPSE